ncbi:MAG: hypothetical protein HC877_22065 [Thioploca sp.]|nr:hypothetical protein [Thioploca sp.]
MIINLPDEVMTELLQVTQTQNQAEAIQIAIQGWLHYQQQQLKLRCGQLKIDDNIAPLRQLELQEVVGTTLPKTKQIDLMQYAGKISWPVDGVVYQRQVRDEWEK